jgi:hypothetical protein
MGVFRCVQDGCEIDVTASLSRQSYVVFRHPVLLAGSRVLSDYIYGVFMFGLGRLQVAVFLSACPLITVPLVLPRCEGRCRPGRTYLQWVRISFFSLPSFLLPKRYFPVILPFFASSIPNLRLIYLYVIPLTAVLFLIF